MLFAALHVILGLGATRAYGSIQFLVIAVVVGWGFDALRRQDQRRAAAEAERAAAVREAYLGPDGIVAGLGVDTVVADTSTVDPETIRGLEADVAGGGATLLDTPVSGSVSVVEAGQILVMAGGDPAGVETARPALEAFSRRILVLGPLGSGATMKLAVNSLVHALNVALAEALVLAEKAGVERSAAYEVFASGASAACRNLRMGGTRGMRVSRAVRSRLRFHLHLLAHRAFDRKNPSIDFRRHSFNDGPAAAFPRHGCCYE